MTRNIKTEEMLAQAKRQRASLVFIENLMSDYNGS